jgi:hypothetical protein
LNILEGNSPWSAKERVQACVNSTLDDVKV